MRIALYTFLRHTQVVIQGQSCVAGSRIFVQEGIYDEFLTAFTAFAADLTAHTGDPFAAGNKHGPQVSKAQFDVCHSIHFRCIVSWFNSVFLSAYHELH